MFNITPLKATVFTAMCFLLLLAMRPAMAIEDFDERVLQVEINKGQTIKLPKAAASVMIANPATADVQVVSPTLIFLHGKKVGETSIYAVDAQDNQIYSAIVQVTHNISNLQREVKRIAPDADINFKTVDGGMVMEGFVGSVSESENIRSIAAAYIGDKEKMVNMIRTNGSDQVMLKVKMVEMKRVDLKKLGVNLQNVTNNGNFGLQLLQGKDILFHTADPDVQALRAFDNVLYRGSSTNSGLMLRYKDLSSLVDALETQGLASVLAEPSLTTTSGQAASFLAGGQFPLPVFGANNTVTLDYKPFGVSLNFTPTVMSHDRISLSVSPEVSTLDFTNPIQVSGVTYPILLTRKATATVELGSGDSFMMAGLLQHETSNNISKFPGIGDVPILGSLFRSTSFQNDETELAIIVTPYIVRPVAQANKLQVPTDGYVPPNEAQRLLYGSLYQQQPMGTPPAAVQQQEQTIAMPTQNGGGFIEE